MDKSTALYGPKGLCKELQIISAPPIGYSLQGVNSRAKLLLLELLYSSSISACNNFSMYSKHLKVSIEYRSVRELYYSIPERSIAIYVSKIRKVSFNY